MGYAQHPQGFPASRLHSKRYELQLTNFLVDSPLLVRKKKAWPITQRARRQKHASPTAVTIIMAREEVGTSEKDSNDNDSSDQNSSELSHDDSDADSESSESEVKVTAPSKKKGQTKHTPAVKVAKHEKCLKDEVLCQKKKKKEASFEDTDTGDLADISEPETPLKSCLKKKDTRTVTFADQPELSEEVSSAAETADASTTEGDSTDAVVHLSDDEDSNVGPSTADDGKSNATTNASGNWTASEDAAILSMKERGETWASIGKAIGRGKKETQKRWKELTTDNITVTTAADTENDADNEMTDGPAAKKGKGNGKVNPRKKPKSALVTISSNSDDELGNTSDNNVDTSETGVYTHLYSKLYLGDDGVATAAALEPDADFDAQECDVLKIIDAKHKVNRWLEVQAEFFNATGRMIPVKVLRRKLEGGDKKMASIVKADEI